ncbi:MAG: outer membrane beta-barrel protein [Deferrisomatales bacterium]|nr:outer membrane beta-barrel protein [Deferrisomatales bacterium]
MKGNTRFVIIGAFALVCLSAEAGRSETFLDLYLGVARVEDATVSVTHQHLTILGPGQRFEADRRVSFDSAPVFGLRLGHWFESAPSFGVALDVSYFKANGDGVDLDVVPLTGLLMLRFPLGASQAFPRGRLQPYGAVGLALVTASMSVDFRPEVPEKVRGGGSGMGVDLRAGLAWHMSRRLAAFGAYRYLQADLKADGESEGFWLVVAGSAEREEVKVDLRTHQLLAGLSVRF